MNVLFNNFLKITKDKKHPYNETLLFYQTVALLYPNEFKDFFNLHLKEKFEQRQLLVKEILKEHSFRIFPEISMIKIEDFLGNKIHDQIINLFDEIEKDDQNSLNYYLEVGFWLDKTHFEIYQISSCFPMITNK